MAKWQQHLGSIHIIVPKQPMIIQTESCRMSLADLLPYGALGDFFLGNSTVRMTCSFVGFFHASTQNGSQGFRRYATMLDYSCG
jgi:hypothetical protein